MSLGLDTNSIAKIYDLLDADGSGSVDLDEFVTGCIAFRGEAKAVDINILQAEHTVMLSKIDIIQNTLDTFEGILKSIDLTTPTHSLSAPLKSVDLGLLTKLDRIENFLSSRMLNAKPISITLSDRQLTSKVDKVELAGDPFDV